MAALALAVGIAHYFLPTDEINAKLFPVKEIGTPVSYRENEKNFDTVYFGYFIVRLMLCKILLHHFLKKLKKKEDKFDYL